MESRFLATSNLGRFDMTLLAEKITRGALWGHPEFDNLPLYLDLYSKIGLLSGFPYEFETSSWVHDTCPSMEFNGQDKDDTKYIKVYVDYLDPELREDKGSADMIHVQHVINAFNKSFPAVEISQAIDHIRYVGGEIAKE